MGYYPFDCIWKGDHIEVFQILDGGQIHQNGIYRLVGSHTCRVCGNPFLLTIQGVPVCFENILHRNLKDVDGSFQMGYYYKKSARNKKESNDALTEHILRLKREIEFAKPLAKAMFLTIKNEIPQLLKIDAIVPIPNHDNDYQKDKKAVALANELGLLYNTNGYAVEVITALKKVSDISITRLNQAQREEAVKDMFSFNTCNIAGKQIMLVDDILTAGNEKGRCATILKQNGASKVWIYVSGRTRG